MNQIPKISVIMPVYNGEQYLRESIESILKQTFTDFEFLIMDDGSTDKSAKILEEYAKKDPRVKIFTQPNQGIVKSLNNLIEKAQSQLIARMDADDIAYPQRFEQQFNYLQEHPETVVLGTLCKIFKENESQDFGFNTAFKEDFINRWFLSIIPCFIHSSVFIRKSALLQSEKYQEQDSHAEDYGLWIRIKRFGKIETLSQVLMDYRLTTSGISAKNFQIQIQTRDRLNIKNLEDIYANNEIPEIEEIKKSLKNYALTKHQHHIFGKLACLTGCFLITKGEYQKASAFFKYSLQLDKRRIDSISNFFLGLFGKSFLISIDRYPLAKKKMLLKIHWFKRAK